MRPKDFRVNNKLAMSFLTTTLQLVSDTTDALAFQFDGHQNLPGLSPTVNLPLLVPIREVL
jgi:hypothetical protein